MTRRDLNNLFALRARIERAEDMLHALRMRSNPGAQILTGMPHATGVQDKTGDFATEIISMEEKIKSLREDLDRQEREVGEFLDGIDDECISTALRLRYVRGFIWKEVADILGQPKKRLTDDCYKFLNSLDDAAADQPSDTDGHESTSTDTEVDARTLSDTDVHQSTSK